MLLHPLLTTRAHQVRGLIRNPAQAEEVRRAGAEPVLCDLGARRTSLRLSDKQMRSSSRLGLDPVAARKLTVDRDGAIRLIDVAKRNGIHRYIMISVMNAEEPRGKDVFRTYLLAKAEADEALRQSGIDWTIVRPGRLTNDPPTGQVNVATELPRAEIPRADVAEVLTCVLETPEASGWQFDVTSDDEPIGEAVARLVSDDFLGSVKSKD